MPETQATIGKDALAWATTKMGQPYVWGGNGPVGYDCSGLWFAAYDGRIPRVTYEEYNQPGTVLKVSDTWEPGDLGFIEGSDSMNGAPGHVGGYVGKGTISGVGAHIFKADPNGKMVFLNAPYTGDPGGIRYDYFVGLIAHTRPALLWPSPPPPPPMVKPAPATWVPNAATLKQCNLVLVMNVADAAKAKKGGWNLWYFGIDHRPHAQRNGQPTKVSLYVNANYSKGNALSLPVGSF